MLQPRDGILMQLLKKVFRKHLMDWKNICDTLWSGESRFEGSIFNPSHY